MDNMTQLYSMMSTQNFLLNQLYARLFMNDPEARVHMPKALIDAATFKSYTAKPDSDQETIIEMQAQVVLNLQHFFSNVEKRIQESERATGQ